MNYTIQTMNYTMKDQILQRSTCHLVSRPKFLPFPPKKEGVIKSPNDNFLYKYSTKGGGYNPYNPL